MQASFALLHSMDLLLVLKELSKKIPARVIAMYALQDQNAQLPQKQLFVRMVNFQVLMP